MPRRECSSKPGRRSSTVAGRPSAQISKSPLLSAREVCICPYAPRPMSTAVQTVRGPVQPTDLGPTLMHEHVFVMAPEALVNYGAVWGPAYWDEEERVADAIAKLTRLREGGITTLVD